MLVLIDPPGAPLLTRRGLVIATVSVLFTAIWAMLCNLVIEVLQVGGNLQFVRKTPLDENLPLFLLGSALVWVVVLLLWSVAGRIDVAAAVVALGAILVGYANYKKLSIRGEPIYPSDFDFLKNAGFLTHMVTPAELTMTAGFAILVAGTVLMSGRFIRLHIVTAPTPKKTFRGWWRVARAVTALACLSTLLYAHNFNDSGNRFRAIYETSGAHWKFWFQGLNYASNGFVGGFLYNMPVPAMTIPRGYSEASMNALADKYSRRATAINAGRTASALKDVNVVLVLSEAFSDPTAVAGPHFAEDPIPKTRRLMKRTTSGAMLAQLFGGGTANMEFETLTGMSLAQFEPQMNSPYQMLVPDYQVFPSAVGYFRHLGHGAIAVHPYMKSMYKREEVYPILGFQRFIGEQDMASKERLGRSEFISDNASFAEVESRLRQSANPLLVNLVTMQNHYPMADLYADPISVHGLSGDEERQASGYARGLAYTDEALADFLHALRQSSEKTAVVFYGDHLPAFWSQETQDRNGIRRMRETPFFMWTNFKKLPHSPSPTTSPVQFLPMLFDALDAPLPPYYVLLDELRKEIPAMEQGEYVDAANDMVTLQDLSPHARELLRDYRLVQYDLSVGHRYSQATMFYPPEPLTSRASE